MRKHLAFGFAIVVAGLGMTPGLAMAQSAPEQRWSITFGAGTAPTLSGIYHEGGSGKVLNLPTTVEERNWSDIYNSGFAMKLGLGYAVTPQFEVTGSYFYTSQDPEELSVGTVAGLDLRSVFGDYRDWGIEGGMRWHFAPAAKVSPFIGAAVGIRRVDAMPATFSVTGRQGGPGRHAVLRLVHGRDVRRGLRPALRGLAAGAARRRREPSLERRPVRPRGAGRHRPRKPE